MESKKYYDLKKNYRETISFCKSYILKNLDHELFIKSNVWIFKGDIKLLYDMLDSLKKIDYSKK